MKKFFVLLLLACTPLFAQDSSSVGGLTKAVADKRYVLLNGLNTMTATLGLLVSATDPTSPTPAEGDVYCNSTTGLKIYHGGAWVASGDGVFLPMTGGTVSGETTFQSNVYLPGDGLISADSVSGSDLVGTWSLFGNLTSRSLMEQPGSSAPSGDIGWMYRYRSGSGYTMNVGSMNSRFGYLNATHTTGTAQWLLEFGQTNGEWGNPITAEPAFRLIRDAKAATAPWIAQVWDSSSRGGEWLTLWNAGNDGADSTLNADLLDGQHASEFAASAAGVAIPANPADIGKVYTAGAGTHGWAALPAETDPNVSAWAKSATKPTYTAAEVGAIATGGETDPSVPAHGSAGNLAYSTGSAWASGFPQPLSLTGTSNAGYVGIHSTVGVQDFDPATSTLYVAGIPNREALMIDNSGAFPPGIAFRKARGTYAAPLVCDDGDQLGYLDFRAYSGGVFQHRGGIQVHTQGTYTDGQLPAVNMRFHTAGLGEYATERVRISPSGRVTIGDSTYHGSGFTTAGSLLVQGPVGIGTNAPAANAKLQLVNTTGYSPLYLDTAYSSTGLGSGNGILLANTDTTVNNRVGIMCADASGGAASAAFGVQFTNRTSHYGDAYIETRSAGGYTEKFRITSTGTPKFANNYLTAATMTANYTGAVASGWSSYSWTNAMVVAAADVKVCTLPAKTVVKNAYMVINTAGTNMGAATLTVSLGRTSADYLDYLAAGSALASANTVYGDASGERGANLTGYDMPSFTANTDVYCHFATDGAGGKTLADVLTSTGTVYIETVILP